MNSSIEIFEPEATIKARARARAMLDLPDLVRQRPRKTVELEEAGWRDFLMTLFPFAFSAKFSADHEKFWSCYWSVLMRMRAQQNAKLLGLPITPDMEISNRELTFLVILGRGLGKCLDGDTSVSLADGTRTTMRDIQVGAKVLSVNQETGQMEEDVVTCKWGGRRQPCITVRTKSSKSLTLTRDHRVLTFTGWKRAGDLTTEDRIASPRRYLAPQTEVRQDEEVRLLAYFLAEGNTTEHRRRNGGGKCLAASITNADASIVADVVRCATALGFKTKQGPRYITYLSDGVRQWIRDQGMAGKKSTHKRLPSWVFALPHAQKWQFLSAFIDTDGWIGMNGKVGITLANEAMVGDLHDLFLQVGVSSIVKFKKNDFANAWELRCDQEGINANFQYIKLLAKQAALDKHMATTRYSLQDVYPFHVFRGLPWGIGFDLQKRGLHIGKRYDITRAKLRRAIEMYSHPRWTWLEKADVWWDRVVSVEGAGERETFDVEIGKNHNLVTNALVSHNSSSVEPSAVMRGALLDGGYTLFISDTDEQAEEHLGNTKTLIEHPDSRLLEFYPGMEIMGSVGKGIRKVDRQSQYVARNGWIARAKPLSGRMRGVKRGSLRPNQFIIDDIDDVDDSIEKSLKKLSKLTRSVLPTQAVDEPVIIIVAQNLIGEHTVVNQIYTGRSSAMAERTTIGPSSTFVDLHYETRFDPIDGTDKHYILPTSVRSWEGVSMANAQKFLHDSGLEAFLAEYQNQFDIAGSGSVLENWRDSVHVISEAEFESVYRPGKDPREPFAIPKRWYKYLSTDFSRTKSAYHAMVGLTVTVASENEPFPGAIFLYNPSSFPAQTEADDVAIRFIRQLTPPELNFDWDKVLESSLNRQGLEVYRRDVSRLLEARRTVLSGVIPELVAPILRAQNVILCRGSHEQAQNALMVYNNAYGLPFVPANPGKHGGLSTINNLTQVDVNYPHPFRPDQMGYTRMFLIVPNAPRDPDLEYDEDYIDPPAAYPKELKPDALHDDKLCRYQFVNWKMVPIKVTERGIIEYGPKKMNDDFPNALQFLYYDGSVTAAPLTDDEDIDARLREIYPDYTPEAIALRVSQGADAQGALATRERLLRQLEHEVQSEGRLNIPLLDYLEETDTRSW